MSNEGWPEINCDVFHQLQQENIRLRGIVNDQLDTIATLSAQLNELVIILVERETEEEQPRKKAL